MILIDSLANLQIILAQARNTNKGNSQNKDTNTNEIIM